MASILANTHKTYDDLKRIESVMNGMVKSKRHQAMSVPTTPTNKIRAKTLEASPFYHPKLQKPLQGQTFKSQISEVDSRTIKKSKII